MHKNTTSYTEQILEATSHKTAAVQPLTSHLQSQTNKTCGTVLKKQGQTFKCHSHGCASVSWPTRTYPEQLCIDTGCSLEDLLEVMDDGTNGKRELGKSMLATRHDDDDYFIQSWTEKFMSYMLLMTFYQWHSRTATPTEEMSGLQGGLLKNKPHMVTFHKSILVSLKTFHIFRISAVIWTCNVHEISVCIKFTL